ncbi:MULTISPECIES: hypothetical protein [Clostridia]|uniref:hypothetical protein n=1 Tax=Clostridia TaxID=186801 RepID=UPI000E502C48|nr:MULTISPECIES: hypothetical protein [Clostridia]RHV70093.1 hypothetical protein DXB15_07220 [Roseburia sp. OM02-15]
MRKFKYMLMCGMLLGCSIMSYPAMAANAQDIVSNSENIICDTKDDLQQKSVNPLDYEENTRERFVASMASDYNISYEMADKMEREQSKSIATVIGIVKAEGDEKNDLDTSSTWSEQYRAYVITKVKTYSTKVLYSELQ